MWAPWNPRRPRAHRVCARPELLQHVDEGIDRIRRHTLGVGEIGGGEIGPVYEGIAVDEDRCASCHLCSDGRGYGGIRFTRRKPLFPLPLTVRCMNNRARPRAGRPSARGPLPCTRRRWPGTGSSRTCPCTCEGRGCARTAPIPPIPADPFLPDVAAGQLQVAAGLRNACVRDEEKALSRKASCAFRHAAPFLHYPVIVGGARHLHLDLPFLFPLIEPVEHVLVHGGAQLLAFEAFSPPHGNEKKNVPGRRAYSPTRRICRPGPLN